eukprot:3966483-Karenia_brevis.AAC.1
MQGQVLGKGAAPRLDAAIKLCYDLAAEAPQIPPANHQWREHAQAALELIQEELSEAEQGLDKLNRESWDAWQKKALLGGAKAMHRLTKLKAEWVPTVVPLRDEVGDLVRQGTRRTAAPGQVLKSEVQKYKKFWQVRPKAPEPWDPDREALPRPTPQQYRDASATFSFNSAQTLD